MNNKPKSMKIIVIPSILTNPVYLKGLRQLLEEVAEILDLQDKNEYALALRYAAEVVDIYTQTQITKEAVLKFS